MSWFLFPGFPGLLFVSSCIFFWSYFLVLFFPGYLVSWFPGLLVFWVLLVCCFYGPLIFWSISSFLGLFPGYVMSWLFGFLVSWFPEVLVSGCRNFLVSWFLVSQCQSWLPFCSPNSVFTLGGSYGRCKGRCLIRVLTLGVGIFSKHFRINWLLWNADMHFDCAGSHKVCVCVLGWHFSCKFPYKSGSREMLTCISTAQARAKCVSAFGAGSGAQYFTCKFPLTCILTIFDCAGSHKVWS